MRKAVELFDDACRWLYAKIDTWLFMEICSRYENLLEKKSKNK